AAAGIEVEQREPVARIIVIAVGKAVESLGETPGFVVTGVYPAGRYHIVTGLATREGLERLAETPGVAAIYPDTGLDFFAQQPPTLELQQLRRSFLLGAEPAAAAPAVEPAIAPGAGLPAHYTVNLTRAVDVWTEFGETGSLARIAIIDTGVDYASPGLGMDALAYDDNYLWAGWYGLPDRAPLILDDSLGIVLTPVAAEPVNNTTIYVNVSKLHYFLPLFDLILKANWTFTMVYSPYTGTLLLWHTWQVPQYWKVPEYVNLSMAPKFGLVYRTLYVLGYYVIGFAAPALIVDTIHDNDSYYDSIIVDFSTAYYHLYPALQALRVNAPAPNETIYNITDPDYSFADEIPINFTNPIAAVDLDGDGYYDFSIGTLAGYLHDTYAIALFAYNGIFDRVFNTVTEGVLSVGQLPFVVSKYGNIEMWGYEPIGYIWPSLDGSRGSFVVLSYDFHSHGTFCASTAAGRPVPWYTGMGLQAVTGQAPSAKVAAAPALYAGDVLAALYFFSGYVATNIYGLRGYLKAVNSTPAWVNFSGVPAMWRPLRLPPVDFTSNSWGASGWALWGWASGLDPISVAVDFTTASTGITHFIAAGNGGPGWGTVAVPGAAAFAVTVGAATEFTYRPFFGYLPGGNRLVVSWSDRGPVETGIAKPDIVAIGSFAWAVGRPWDAMGWGVFSGAYAVDLFGGTSQATPMTAGVAALVVSAFKRALNETGLYNMTGWEFLPLHGLLKTVLMNAAYDMGFDPFSQGAGFVDAYRAVEKAVKLVRWYAGLEQEPPTLVASLSVARYMARVAGVNYQTMSYSAPVLKELPLLALAEPKLVVAGTAGSVGFGTITVLGKGEYEIRPVRLAKVYEAPLTRARGVYLLEQPGLLEAGDEEVYVNLSALGYAGLVPVALINPSWFTGYDVVTIDAVYPLKYFDPAARTGSGGSGMGIYSNGFELWYWIDLNGDGQIQLNETARIQYDLRGANSFHLQVAKLREQLAEIERLVKLYTGVDVANARKMLVLVYRVLGNWWSGEGSVVAPFKIVVRGYEWTPWPASFWARRYMVVDGTGSMTLLFKLPPAPGVYEGYLRVKSLSTGEEILVPVTLVAAAQIRSPFQVVQLPGEDRYMRVLRGEEFYWNPSLRGAFDYTWRYESGDWRVIPVIVRSTSVKFLYVEVEWPAADKEYASNLDVMVFGPYTYYMVEMYSAAWSAPPYPAYTVRVNGLQLGGELTVSHTVYWDDPEPGLSRIMVPVSGPGVYYVVVRNIQFSGEELEEPYRLRVVPVSMYSFPEPAIALKYRPTFARMFLRAPALLDWGKVWVEPFNETLMPTGTVANCCGYTATMVYYPEQKFNVSVWSSSSLRVPPRLTLGFAMLKLETLDKTLLRGTYLQPVMLSVGVPEWSVGYMFGGIVGVYYYQDWQPVMLRIFLR
ncbi:MAG: S8 family serine peptidase, partial [Crenarchaeota archaeon]|nr:S8 family serine peptidase [Thermoproteota archaeon]